MRRMNVTEHIWWFFGGALFLFPSLSTAQTHVVQKGETLYSLARKYAVEIDSVRSWNQLEGSALSIGQTLLFEAPGSGAVEREVTGRETPAVEATEREVSSQEDETQGTDFSASSQPSASSTAGPELPKEYFYNPDPVPMTLSHIVRQGDTLYDLAEAYGVTVSSIRALNRLSSNTLSIGQQLIIKQLQPTPAVQKGDGSTSAQGRFLSTQYPSNTPLETFLTRYQMTQLEFERLNRGLDLTNIPSGTEVVVLAPPSRVFQNPYVPAGRLSSATDPNGVLTTSGSQVSVFAYDEEPLQRITASGEIYNPETFTAAHAVLPFGTIVFIQDPDTQIGTFVRINDRILEPGLKISRATCELVGCSSVTESTLFDLQIITQN
ncbi:MAG: LysM peptidoglycan-binding domain-containing protein [Bacteroidetes bacterium]|nr:LysM peptidoglycan-binding domain-containing protein [Bacteroidota bacterium]